MEAPQRVFQTMLRLRDLRQQLEDRQKLESELKEQLEWYGQDDCEDMMRMWNEHVAAASLEVSIFETAHAWLDDVLAAIPDDWCTSAITEYGVIGKCERYGAGRFVGFCPEVWPKCTTVCLLVAEDVDWRATNGEPPTIIKYLPPIPFQLFDMMFTRDANDDFKVDDLSVNDLKVSDYWGTNGCFGRKSRSWLVAKQQTVLSDLTDARQKLFTCLERMRSQLDALLAPRVLRERLATARDDQLKLSADIKSLQESVEEILKACNAHWHDLLGCAFGIHSAHNVQRAE
jgi:hypothetical protein